MKALVRDWHDHINPKSPQYRETQFLNWIDDAAEAAVKIATFYDLSIDKEEAEKALNAGGFETYECRYFIIEKDEVEKYIFG